jgi:hypothetical protein
MMFFEDITAQAHKKKLAVCGDFYKCERTARGTVYILCDGVGSGVYANIAAINCAARLLELYRAGLSIRAASETVAASMHRARTEDFPFSAFSAAVILPNGDFVVYVYEAPNPILMQDNRATVLDARFYTVGFEVVGEVTGSLSLGDSLLLFSDGVSQAGLGHGYGLGIGSEGATDFINHNFASDDEIHELPARILELCKKVSDGQYEDDTTLALLHCREGMELTLLSGPPSKSALDSVYATDFINSPGKKIICGSTTTDIIARELKRDVVTLNTGDFGHPPEYWIDGVDLVAEGAITLTQVNNILEEPPDRLTDDTVPERLCLMLRESDIIRFMTGSAANAAHEDMIFKQIGVMVRKAAIERLQEKLTAMGKLVTEKFY